MLIAIMLLAYTLSFVGILYDVDVVVYIRVGVVVNADEVLSCVVITSLLTLLVVSLLMVVLLLSAFGVGLVIIFVAFVVRVCYHMSCFCFTMLSLVFVCYYCC